MIFQTSDVSISKMFKLFHVSFTLLTLEVWNIICNSIINVKFEQNRMIQTSQNFELFDKKAVDEDVKTIFDKSITISILKEVSVSETIKLRWTWIKRLLPLIIPKITLVWYQHKIV